MDGCTRTTSKDTLACGPQETHKSCALPQRTEKAKESMTSMMKGHRKGGRNRSTLIFRKSQYVFSLSNSTEHYGKNTDGQSKPLYPRHYCDLHQLSLYPTRKPYTWWTRGSDQLLVHCLRRVIQSISPVSVEEKEWCRRHLPLHMKVNAATCLYSPHIQIR